MQVYQLCIHQRASMQPVPAERERNPGPPETGEFFIPDLCAPRAVFVMVLLAELLVLVYSLGSSDLPRFNWDLFARCSLFVQWVVLVSALFLCWSRKPFSRLSLPLATLFSLGLILAVTAATSVVALELFPRLAGTTERGWWILRNQLVALVMGGIVLRYFYLQQLLRQQEKLELQARLDSLRSRIRPHFLFNTLNSIASLIASRPQAAEQAVEDLSELFRASLKESRGQTTVADEVRLCELYLGIEQLRLGERLAVQWQVAERAGEQAMPSLILQPLVENAVYHGIARLPEGGCIRIGLDYDGERVFAELENPVPDGGRRPGGSQLALANVEQRLQATYGAAASLQTFPSEQLFRVQLSYPPGSPL
ncbi:sensor histidine kinase [Seongchinamella sediminis]|nr:histidine kinase [Seongchinamella sediminis]